MIEKINSIPHIIVFSLHQSLGKENFLCYNDNCDLVLNQNNKLDMSLTSGYADAIIGLLTFFVWYLVVALSICFVWAFIAYYKIGLIILGFTVYNKKDFFLAFFKNFAQNIKKL